MMQLRAEIAAAIFFRWQIVPGDLRATLPKDRKKALPRGIQGIPAGSHGATRSSEVVYRKSLLRRPADLAGAMILRQMEFELGSEPVEIVGHRVYPFVALWHILSASGASRADGIVVHFIHHDHFGFLLHV